MPSTSLTSHPRWSRRAASGARRNRPAPRFARPPRRKGSLRGALLALGATAVVLAGVGACDYDDGEPHYDNTVPDNAYCAPVGDWDPAWVDWENDIVSLMNEERARGAECGGEPYGPVPALKVSPALRCASRNHSQDMHDRQFFDHTNPDGEGPSERFDRAGYEGSGWGENIIAGHGSPEAMVQGWMDSPGHCRNIMSDGYTHVGLGYFFGPDGYRHYATAGFGRE